MELSRQRIRPPIETGAYLTCPYCQGRGMVRSPDAAALAWLRRIWQGVTGGQVIRAEVTLPLEVASYLLNRKREELLNLERRYDVQIRIEGRGDLPPEGGTMELIRREEAINA